MAYLRLLWSYYDTEKPLPDDPETLAFQVGADASDVRLILSNFFQLEGGAWRHKRCDKEIYEYHAKAQKAAESANARWKNANAMRTHSERNANAPKNDANQEPRTKNQEPVKRERASPTGSRLPPEWQLPDEWALWARAERPDLNPIETAARFADYWHGTAGAKGRKADWQATWRNWVRNEKRSASTPQSFAQQDEMDRRRRWEEMTGRQWPDQEPAPTTFDFEDLQPKRIQ